MEQIKQYLQRNWFKLGIVLILVLVALKKDLSFRVHLNNPAPKEQRQTPPKPVQDTDPEPKAERFSENTKHQSAAAAPNQTERFDFTPGSSSSSKKPEAATDRLAEVETERIQKYIERFDRVAISEQEKFGIPAAITLANALLHSRAGTADWAEKGINNHFALPCTPDWNGPKAKYENQCMRQYENAWTSFRDHSLYLTTGPFAHLTQLPANDAKGWAEAMEKAGFSSEPDLADQLMEVIRRYGLE